MAHLCPNSVSKNEPPKAQTIAVLSDRIRSLEAFIERHGLSAELGLVDDTTQITDYSPTPRSRETRSSTPGRAIDMVAMLGQLTLQNQSTRRPAGAEASAYYLASPADSDDEGSPAELNATWLGWAPGRSREYLGIPWASSRTISLGGKGSLPGQLLDRCRALLPTKRAAKEMLEVFWKATSWR
jgi:hypothetical protein